MIPTSYKLLENIIANCSDKDLEESYAHLKFIKEERPIQYRSAHQAPFVRDVFSMIEDEYAYRNQEIDEENLAVH